MKINQVISTIAVTLSFYCSITEGFAEKTHKAISENALIYSQTDAYLKNQLDFSQGLGTTLLLLDQLVLPWPERIPFAQFEARIIPELPSNPCSILNYFKAGANLEDVPNPRARHHFHDPTRNSGLNDQNDHPNLAMAFNTITLIRFPGYSFDLTGASAQLRATGTEGAEWETEYLNYYAWPDARIYFYRSLTKSSFAERKHYLAVVFLSLGHTVHLLEDSGVPARARNDFVYGHMGTNGSVNYKDWGNLLEHWAENWVEDNNDNIPSAWLTGWTPQPKVFDKISKYWDTDTYEGTYIGLPSPAWGLAEQTNYQFISTSTFPGSPGILYQFPNPAEAHFGSDLQESVPTGIKLYFNGSNYGVSHIARRSYTQYYADKHGVYGQEIDGTITPDDDNVCQDYTRITIPRTIDFASGLINYFFRGKLSVTASCSNAECDPIEIYITNQSVNTNVNQTLKGGSFGLYWDDNSGNRTQASGLTVYDSNDPNRTVLWGASTTLAKGNSVRATFNKPSSPNLSKYVLVYHGSISANPNNPDPNDSNAIAVCAFDPPGPPRPLINLITPGSYSCPGSILLIEGSGFSGTPSNNIVLFEDVNSVRPDVYGIVQAADVNGQWLRVELPYFYAEDVDYYWSNATVTVDGNTSEPYAYKLSNYVWLTILIWDDGTSLDDDFDLYVNGEYWLTAYAPPPEDPVIVEYGFWYQDEYCYVDTYLIDSYSESGGTLGVAMWDYVNRVVANRWNSSSQLPEFLYDQEYWWSYLDYFGIDVLDIPGDGVLLDVYAFPTYDGDLGSKRAAPITTLLKKNTIGKGEQLKRFVPADISQRTLKTDIPRKRGVRGAAPNRIGTKK